jgi:Zn finger protein HypA/HybF involved in hydrogenase expression
MKMKGFVLFALLAVSVFLLAKDKISSSFDRVSAWTTSAHNYEPTNKLTLRYYCDDCRVTFSVENPIGHCTACGSKNINRIDSGYYR